MHDLLRHPVAPRGQIHNITPASANWTYVGFSLHVLADAEGASGHEESREAILVLVEGKAAVTVGQMDLGPLGTRDTPFDRTPPDAVYIPAGEPWSVVALGPCTLAVCSAPGHGGHKARLLDRAETVTRGEGTNLRYINNIAMEADDVADSLLVTEVFTPAGHWSSYPPHRHDEDDYPRMTYLEETYYHRLNPATGFGIQRVFTDDLGLDETMAVADGDVVLVPRGHHPCAAPHGVEMYYLNVMAGPRRAWRYETHPDFRHLTPDGR